MDGERADTSPGLRSIPESDAIAKVETIASIFPSHIL
jgi:hypothetical protein